MIDAFVEGARSIVQACHLVILAPVAAIVLAGRARWQVTAGAVAGVLGGGWAFAARWVPADEATVRWSSLVVLAATIAVASLTLQGRYHLGWSVGAAGVAGFVVTTWWRPCVGIELGEILTRAPGQPWSQLLPSIGFMLGISLPIGLLALGIAAWQPGAAAGRRLTLAAASVGALLAVSVMAGRHGQIVATLLDWSQPFV